MKKTLTLSLFVCALLFLTPFSVQADLTWSQAGGSSNSSGTGTHINSFVTGGSDGSATFVGNDSILSYGTVSDGSTTADYSVTFVGGTNPITTETINNAFVVHSNGAADFYSSSYGKRGVNDDGSGSGTFADNGAVSIAVNFFDQGTFNAMTGTGTAANASFSLLAINLQPPGGNTIKQLNTNEFFDVDWNGVGGAVTEIDPDNQIYTGAALGSTVLNNYSFDSPDHQNTPLGSTGESDPGTGGYTNPLTGDLRIGFDTTHRVSGANGANWEVALPESSTFIISRPGDSGQRSGIGLGGTLTASVPEPSGIIALMAFSGSLIFRRRRNLS